MQDAESQPRGLEQPFTIVSREHLHDEIETPLYYGGVVYPRDAAIQPARLVRALCDRAVAAGAMLRSHCAVQQIGRSASGFEVVTSRGRIAARQVLVATNGYTGAFAPWQRRRILPIGSYIIATEPLDRALVARLLPRGRNVSDTRRVVVYFRPSPDGTRILFGGRASAGEVDVTRCVPRLRAMLGALFPPARAGPREPRLDGTGRLHVRHPAAPRRARRTVLLHGLLRPGDHERRPTTAGRSASP